MISCSKKEFFFTMFTTVTLLRNKTELNSKPVTSRIKEALPEKKKPRLFASLKIISNFHFIFFHNK